MKTPWTRDNSGYYQHADYPDLWVRSTNSVGYCQWEVVRSNLFPSTTNPRIEQLGRYKTLALAKREVEMEGARWTRKRAPAPTPEPDRPHVIVRPRQGGKTTELIRLAAKHFAYIVVPDRQQARHVANTAKMLALDIPFPITWAELLEGRYAWRGARALAVDNLDTCLEQITGRQVVGVTLAGQPEVVKGDPARDTVIGERDQYGRVHVRVDVDGQEYVGWLEPAVDAQVVEDDDQLPPGHTIENAFGPLAASFHAAVQGMLQPDTDTGQRMADSDDMARKLEDQR